MQKKTAKRNRSIKNLALITTMTAVVLVVSTYAWFIALNEVRVNEFNVTMASTEGLELSIDGSTWFGGSDNADKLTIDDTTYDTGAYAGHTNSWTGIKSSEGDTTEFWGLVPMSSSGQVDATSSRLALYEKSSLTSSDLDDQGDLTATQWGARLMATQVENGTGKTEQRGYIAFDLFVKNNTEIGYYDEVNIQNEEAIYLTTDSAVTPGLDTYGIENSVRVGFAQIARVEIPESGDLTAAEAAALVCGATDVQSICRPATIWEPNDLAHAVGAIEYYDKNCKVRPYTEGETDTCTAIENGSYAETYAITGDIAASDAIDIYDGVYNGNTTIATGGANNLELIYDMTDTTLVDSMDNALTEGLGYYFTDTEKDTGITRDTDGTITDADQDARPPFMYLAPNSITKVRVYVWLEGQDIDNYDWASLGKSVSVNFGFTKQQLSDEMAQ